MRVNNQRLVHQLLIRVDWLSHEPCFVWRICVGGCRKIFCVQIWYEKHGFPQEVSISVQIFKIKRHSAEMWRVCDRNLGNHGKPISYVLRNISLLENDVQKIRSASTDFGTKNSTSEPPFYPGHNFSLLLTILSILGFLESSSQEEHIEPTLATTNVKTAALQPSVLAATPIFRQKSSCISHFALLARND